MTGEGSLAWGASALQRLYPHSFVLILVQDPSLVSRTSRHSKWEYNKVLATYNCPTDDYCVHVGTSVIFIFSIVRLTMFAATSHSFHSKTHHFPSLSIKNVLESFAAHPHCRR